ncbi:hypothetical protein ACXR2U_10325, partial [Jatrophihabitans sp. YIM 134969]
MDPGPADAWSQGAYAVRLEWGPTGGAVVATGADTVVVVDVLSFTTTVSVAVGLGVEVLPSRWGDDQAARFAAAHAAAFGAGRSRACAGAGARA